MKEKGRKSRKTITMYGALHAKSDVDRLYITRNKGYRGLMKVENSLCFYVANSEENLIKGVAVAEKMLKIL